MIKVSTYALYNTLLALEAESNGLIERLSKMGKTHWSDLFNSDEFANEFNAMQALSATNFTQENIAMHCSLLLKTKKYRDIYYANSTAKKQVSKPHYVRVRNRVEFINQRRNEKVS
jgi:hypothetical protein